MSGAAGSPGVWDQSAPEATLAPVALLPWGADTWALVLQPGADVADLLAVAATMPARLMFTEAFGDVDVALVFEVAPGPSRRAAAGAVLRAALAPTQHPRPAGDGSRWMTPGEQKAYRAGWDEAVAYVRRTALAASGAPESLVPRADPE